MGFSAPINSLNRVSGAPDNVQLPLTNIEALQDSIQKGIISGEEIARSLMVTPKQLRAERATAQAQLDELAILPARRQAAIDAEKQAAALRDLEIQAKGEDLFNLPARRQQEAALKDAQIKQYDAETEAAKARAAASAAPKLGESDEALLKKYVDTFRKPVPKLPNGQPDLAAVGEELQKAPVDMTKTTREALAKLPQLRNAQRGIVRIEKALEALKKGKLFGLIDTGPADQHLVRPTDDGQELEAAVGSIQNSVLALTRVPGIGSQSDLEARAAKLQYPGLNMNPVTNARTLEGLKAFMDDLQKAYEAVSGGKTLAAGEAEEAPDNTEPVEEGGEATAKGTEDDPIPVNSPEEYENLSPGLFYVDSFGTKTKKRK